MQSYQATITDDNGKVVSKIWGRIEAVAFEVAEEVEQQIANGEKEVHVLISDV